ncbi:MAG: hypothetical protein UT86_C0003G0121 [Candidatus Magasanikbacteria bacterium GW2011_GWC2_40_17]|uniref:IrrE N-terminal-like domain-containing protein n=1 Tax=Candidatus Magasanikbacteria bacterium GW2011_GWA2_42_32 TaxID=1619039 RepID=A0A0G1A7L1_9BACT|nr:MAG: hypothetical protein UT86_C0003G0121 [Candidatus Magasanikbacteria bacterium GW2011_GWC2_40_17]KKS57025.1 MAG: hypothetical protein UV20_C0004G0121 [Candidatus Magasanikbacteria bacterium GW2011_GWA2_42_32]
MGKVNFVNTNNLKIARENVGLDVYRASKNIAGTKRDMVVLWESGQLLPTWKQLEKAAKVYNTSALLLVSKKNIKENKEIPDFRIGLHDDIEKDEVKKLIDLVLKRQGWLEQVYRKEGKNKNKLIGSGSKIGNPKELAQHIANTLEINIHDIKTITGSEARRQVLKYLIKKAEDKGIFVGKTVAYHKISVEQMRGLFISNDYCPFIILNRRDALSAQIFSFIHELAHFYRKSDSISNSIDFRDTNKDINPEETLCNKVAANLLLPEDEFVKVNYDKDDIDVLAELYKLSKLFIFYRLKWLNKISRTDADKIEEELRKESERNLEYLKNRKKKTGGNYYYSMQDSNGDLFNRTVAGAYFENKINYSEASNLLKFSVEFYE